VCICNVSCRINNIVVWNFHDDENEMNIDDRSTTTDNRSIATDDRSTVTDESCVSVYEERMRTYEMMRSKKLRKGRR